MPEASFWVLDVHKQQLCNDGILRLVLSGSNTGEGSRGFWITYFLEEEKSIMRIFEGQARVPLKGWQQAAVAVGSALGALMNPARADLIAALGETTGKLAFQNLLDRMKRSHEGRLILQERPRVISSAVGHAWDLPENTFGAAYAKFMGSRNFSPDDRPPVRFMDTEELAYVATRAREIHDFWHVLFNLPTNMIGESALKVVEFQQLYLPMCLLSTIGGSVRMKAKQRENFFKYYFPWAIRAGMSCTDIMSIYYEKHFDEDLELVRKRWGILPAPDLKNLRPPSKSR